MFRTSSEFPRLRIVLLTGIPLGSVVVLCYSLGDWTLLGIGVSILVVPIAILLVLIVFLFLLAIIAVVTTWE